METSSKAFRERVLEAEQESRAAVDSATIWADLCGGSTRVCTHFSTRDRSYLVLSRSPSPAGAYRPRIEGRRRRLIERALSGTSQKALSIDLGVSTSTVAASLKECVSSLGLHCLPSRVPVLLVLLVQSALNGRALEQGVLSDFNWRGERLLSVSAPKPEALLQRLLSPAEYEAICMLVDGETHSTIAAQRRTSPRTIANQLASAFQRLGVSGRAALVQRIVALPASDASTPHC